MKKTKILSLLLCLSLFCALIVPCTKAYAKSDPDSGMKISKTATANKDGSYTITLEAFATGSKVITEQKTDIPTDIVLVLDQSGSMKEPIGGYTYTAYRKGSEWNSRNYQNKEYYPLRHNGGSENLWHKLNNNEYIAVSVEQKMVYTAIPGWDNGDYYSNQNNLYCLVNGEYKKVSVNRELGFFVFDYTYYVDGRKIGSGSGSSETPTFNDGYAPLYQSVKKYIYSYTLNGATTVIEESSGDGSSPDTQFYRRDYSSSAGGTRLNALKNAVTNFTEEVAKKAAGKDGQLGTNDDVDHRIAVVGYADTDWDYGYNTGVFIGSTLNRYENNAAGVYSTALQDMSTTNGKSNVTASLNALQASGATRTDYGLTMANGILNANPVPTGETRNRVVIVFTDGSPTNSNGFQRAIANKAISTANAIKAGGTTVYSIGIFSGADASTAGKEPDEDYYDDGFWGPNYTDAEMSAACNWFMQKVSSNNGTPRTPSYYLSAGDAASLNNIFQQISNQIETGGAETTLGSETVVKDIISPYFTLPAGTTASDIQIDTYACIGKDGNTYTWSDTSDGSGGATATVSGDQVSVTGFDFSENWCGTETNAQGTTVRGKKLVISFKVESKQDFLGGNDVITNTSAGIYENNNAKDPIMTFDQPKVNVPIKKVTVTATDKNVYLKGAVTADQLKNGATVKVGKVNLDLSKADQNYGLEPWQTEYVDITVTVKDKDGHEISADSLKNLTDDTTYTVTVTVSPKTTEPTSTEGTKAKEQSGSSKGKINVFKPELTFKDSEVYYGDNVPTNYSGNLVSTKWFHTQTVDGQEVKTEDRNVTMVGAPDAQAPVLSVEYIPDASKIKDGRINTKDDIPVAVDVKILDIPVNSYITFVHQACNPACDWNETDLDGNPAFLLHVKTCTLKITKQDGADGEPYVFDICKDGVKYSEVTIVGNDTQTLYELPVGNYTIVENEGWSWRYNASYGAAASLTAQNSTGTITCTNTKNNDQWLNGFSDVVKNIFGVND